MENKKQHINLLDKYMENNLKKRMQEFLEETVRHYNSKNRSTIRGTECVYIPQDSSESEGCAIGRKLTPEYKELIIKNKLNTNCNVINLFKRLGKPEYFKGMPEHFLIRVQGLHDCEDYWNSKGLSDEGIDRLHDTIKLFHLDPIEFLN